MPDGSGGWYVGGNFCSVGATTVSGLAHILSNGTLDPTFIANVLNGSALRHRQRARAVGLDALRRRHLHVGARTGAQQHRRRQRHAPSAAPTAELESGRQRLRSARWRCRARPSTPAAASPRSAGRPATGSPRSTRRQHEHGDGLEPERSSTVNALARLRARPSTPAALHDDRRADPQPDRRARHHHRQRDGLEPERQQHRQSRWRCRARPSTPAALHSIGGQTRSRIAALDAITGVATAMEPQRQRRHRQRAGGVGLDRLRRRRASCSIGGQTRNRIAALDATVNTNMATAWNPSAGTPSTRSAYPGRPSYAGGAFTLGRRRAAATVSPRSTPPPAPRPPGTPAPTAPSTRSRCRARPSTPAAASRRSAAQARNRIAALDATAALRRPGTRTRTAPSTRWRCRARPCTPAAASLDRRAGTRNRSPPSTRPAAPRRAGTRAPANNTVNALAVSGSTVYVGPARQLPYPIGGHLRNADRGDRHDDRPRHELEPQRHRPRPRLRFVSALAVSGSTVYAGGDFGVGRRADPQRHRRDRRDHRRRDEPGTPTLRPTARVNALAVSGSTVYAGGSFGSSAAKPGTTSPRSTPRQVRRRARTPT